MVAAADVQHQVVALQHATAVAVQWAVVFSVVGYLMADCLTAVEVPVVVVAILDAAVAAPVVIQGVVAAREMAGSHDPGAVADSGNRNLDFAVV